MNALAHSSLGPSRSDKWLMCPGFVRATADIEDEPSEPAAEGTAAHAILEMALGLGTDASFFIGHTQTVDGFTFTWQDIDAGLLQPVLDDIRSYGGELHTELRVDLSEWLGGNQFGTLDVGIITDDEIIIDDFKWGRVPVYPRRNPQLSLYALGFWRQIARHKTDIRNVRIVVDQPRSAGGGGEWRTTIDELLAFGETAHQAAEASRDPDAPLIAGEACRYCPKAKQRDGCVALDTFNLELLGLSDIELDGADEPYSLTRELTRERRSYLLQFRPALKNWLDRLERDALAEALEEGDVPHMKAVMGRRPARKWRDEEGAGETLVMELGDGALETKLKSPAAIERTVGRKDFVERFDHLVELGEPQPILVSDEDARPAIPIIHKAFEDLPNEEEN